MSRRSILLCLLAIVPVLVGGAVGALAGGVLPGDDLVTTVPTGTSATPSERPAIDTVAGVAQVGLEEGTPFSGVRRPAGGTFVAGPPQQKGNTDVGPQLVGPDGTITAVWSDSSGTQVLHAARLAPGATNWSIVEGVAHAPVGPAGAVIASDGSITAVTYDNTKSPVTLVSRRLPAGASAWEAPVTIETLAPGAEINGEPQIVRSPTGVVMAGWDEEGSGETKIGGALQATDGSWPAGSRTLVANGAELNLGAIALPDSGRSGRLLINEAGTTPPVRVIGEQITDTGPIPMNPVPAASQGSGVFFATAAAFTPDGTLRILGRREGGISESDVPPTNNGQLPGAPYTVVDMEGGGPELATLPDGEMLLTYAPESAAAETQSLQLLTRPVGGPWSSPEQLQTPIPGQDGGVEVGGIAVDPGGDAYITWSTLVFDTKATLAGAILDNSPPMIDGLSLPGAVAGVPVQLGVSAHDAWSATTARWDFGDGASADGTTPTHAFAAPGAHPVTVTVTDAAGNAATTTGVVNVAPAPPVAPPPAATDKTPPKVAVLQPTCAKKLSHAACRKRRASSASWHVVRGTVSDAGGVASVVLQATSGAGRKCVVLEAKGASKEAPCAKAAKLKATVTGGHWSVKTPGIAAGTWKLSVLATDRAGNAATAHLTLHLAS